MNYSNNFRKVLKTAKERTTTGLIEPNHLLVGVILNEECVGYSMLEILIDMDDAKLKVEELYDNKKNPVDTLDSTDELAKLTAQSEQIMMQAQLEAKQLQSDNVRTEHLILSFTRSQMLEGVTYADAKEVLEIVTGQKTGENKPKKQDNMENPKTKKKSETPLLDEFSTDLTLLASQDKLDPIVGRKKELRRIAQILSRRKKNNPVLIGKPGVGKTAIVEGLSQMIVNRKTPDVLYNKRILALEMGSIVAGTKYRGEFEERMKKIVDELKASDNIILYIDEIHTIVGAGSSAGSLDAANILKPALSRGEINCIGSTTLDEYRKIEKDGALERRFQKIIVAEPTYDETRKILNNLKERYEDYHNVTYTDEAIESCLKLSDRYITDRCFPDKAIDAMDESGSAVRITDGIPQEIIELENKLQEVMKIKNDKVKIQDFEGAAEEKKKQDGIEKEIEEFYKNRHENSERKKVTPDDIADVVSIMTGVPSKNISEDDSEKLITLENKLKSEVIGQDDAVEKITKSILRNKAGLNDTRKPIGTFLFLGPTGVGKTYLAKKLAENLFTSDRDMIRIDMTEYMEKHSVARLVGAPPGYVGHEDGGQLTELVRRNPYSIILLDEIEKAHQDVTNILLQIFEDGILTDSHGKTVNFKNTVIIMTSNVGSREAKARGGGIGFTDNSDQVTKGILERELKRKFSPEFLNRIDNIVQFEVLGKDQIKTIIDLELDNFIKRLEDNGLILELDDTAKDFLFEKGWDPDLGARPLKRAIQKYIEDEISIKLIMKEFVEGDKIKVYKSQEKDADELTFMKTTNLLDGAVDGEISSEVSS